MELYLLWVKPQTNGLHEVQVMTPKKAQTYSINQETVRDLVSFIEDRGLILVSEKPRFPLKFGE